MAEITVNDPATNQDYTVYSRSDLSDEQAINFAAQYAQTGSNKAWSAGQGTLVYPANASPLGIGEGTGAARAKMYDENFAAPISKAITGIQQRMDTGQQTLDAQFAKAAPRETLQGQALSGIGRAAEKVTTGTQQLVGDYIKSTTSDPSLMALAGTTIGAPALINPIAKITPTLVQGLMRTFGAPALAGAAYGASTQLLDPNSTPQEAMVKAGAMAVAGVALNTILGGAAKFFSKGAPQETADSILAKLNTQFNSSRTIQSNPQEWLKEVGDTVNAAGRKQFYDLTTGIKKYVGQLEPQHVEAFNSSLDNVVKAAGDFAGMRAETTGYNGAVDSLTKALAESRDIAVGIGTTGKAFTAPTDAALGRMLGEDTQFVQTLYAQKVLSPTQVARIANGDPSILGKIDRTTGEPFFKGYATAQDIQRVIGKFTQQAGDVNKQALDQWYQSMSQVIQQKIDLERSYAITKAAIAHGYEMDPTQLKRAALKVAQQYDNTGAQAQSVIQALYGTAQGNLSNLSYKTLLEQKSTGWLAKNIAPGTNAPLLGSTGAINLEAARYLNGMRK